MVKFPTRILDCYFYSPALLNLFISSDSSIFSRVALPPLGNSHNVAVSVSVSEFSSNLERVAPFLWTDYDYSHA